MSSDSTLIQCRTCEGKGCPQCDGRGGFPDRRKAAQGEIPVVDDLAIFDLICAAMQSCDTSIDSQANAVLAKLQPYLREPKRESVVLSEDNNLTPAIIVNYRKLISDSKNPEGKYDFFAALADTLLDYIEPRLPTKQSNKLTLTGKDIEAFYKRWLAAGAPRSMALEYGE